MVFQLGDAPYQRRRQGYGEQHVAPSEETAPIDEERREEDLDAIVERHARHEEEHHHRLPYLHRGARLQLSACHIEHHHHHAESEVEMVGHHHGEHDIRHRVEEDHEEPRIGAGEPHDFAHDAEEEHGAVEPEEHLDHCHHDDGTVDAREPDESLVDKVWHVHEDGEQRVAYDIILPTAPLGHYGVAPRVET